MASVMGRRDVKSSRGILVHADCLAENVDYHTAKMVFLPGGRLGTKNLGESTVVKEKCVEFANSKMVSAICAAPSVLDKLGLLDGKEATCHPDYEHIMINAKRKHNPVVIDGNIITGRGLGSAFAFAFELMKMLGKEDKVETIKKQICY